MSSEFWKEVLSWLKDNDIVIESFTEIGLFLGFFEETEDFFIINHVLLLGKYYIYVRKCHGSLPSLRGFITKIRSVYNIELHIARERDKLAIHFKKMGKVSSCYKQPVESCLPWSFIIFLFFSCV